MRHNLHIRMTSFSVVWAVCLAALAVPALARDLRVEVNGRMVRFGSRHQCYLDRGVWMIPARPVLDAARIMNTWDSRRQELEVWARYDRMVVAVGSYTVVRSGGRRETISRPIAMHHGEPYAPVDFLETCLDTRAWYDRQYEVLSFGSPSDFRERDREWWDWGRGGRRRDEGYRPWERNSPPYGGRREGLTIELPPIVHGRHVRVEGYWSDDTVRLRITRVDGRQVIYRTVSVRDGRWYAELSLSPGEYRVVVEGYVGPFVRQRLERNLSVR